MNATRFLSTASTQLGRTQQAALASAFQATSYQQQQQQQQQQRHAKNAFVLNWEDVLAPMTLLHQRLGLQPSRHALAHAQAVFAREQYMQQAIGAIETQIIELLRTASALGPTYVVTERSLKFIEATCATFFPRLALWLRCENSIHVLAAPRTTFASDMEKAAWRVNLLQNVCRDAVARGSDASMQQRMLRSPEFGNIGLVHVSASETDTFACVKAIDVAPHLLPKCVHVRQAPRERVLSLEDFFAQLQMLQRYVVSSAAHTSAFAVSL